MADKNTHRTSNRIRILLVALVVVACAAMFYGPTFARFVRGASGGDSAGVATFDVTSDVSDFEQALTLEMAPGDVETYPFTVNNDSEAAVRVIATVRQDGLVPLVYEYEAGGQRQAMTAGADGTHSFEADLAAGETGAYELVLSWDPAKIGHEYAGTASSVVLNVRTEQAG